MLQKIKKSLQNSKWNWNYKRFTGRIKKKYDVVKRLLFLSFGMNKKKKR